MYILLWALGPLGLITYEVGSAIYGWLIARKTKKNTNISVNVYFVMGFRPFRPNYFTCTAHLYLYCTLMPPI